MPPIFPQKKQTSSPSGNPPQSAPQKAKAVHWKPTAEEQIEIEDLAYSLLASGLLKSQIKAHLKKWAAKKEKLLNGRVSIKMDSRTIERYLSRARARMREESGKTTEELREDSLNFYLSIARDITADPRSRIQARERVDRLYGLDKPVKVAPTDPTGDKPYEHLSDAELAARIAEHIAASNAGNTAPAS